MVVILMDGSQVPFGGPFKISRQMSPCSSILGWYTRVINWHLGGSNGYLFAFQRGYQVSTWFLTGK